MKIATNFYRETWVLIDNTFVIANILPDREEED
jgi:hypothetical protein